MMQQGIQSLMPQGPQQGPMPGQAPQMPMPGMMPQPSAPTPQAMVGPLTQMHLQQLTQMMLNPRPDGPPLYAVLSAISEKQKQAQAQASMQRQMAMAQGQQAAQQPPVAQQVLAQAQQQAAQPRMGVEDYKRQAAALSEQGRHAEAMQLLELAKEQEHREFTRQGQEYAGGGAVAFKDAGYVPPQEPGETFEEYRQRVIRYQDEQRAAEVARKRARAEEERLAELARRGGPSPGSPFFASGQRAVDTSKLFPFGLPESPMMDVPEIQIASPQRAGAAPGTGQPRQQVAPAPAQAAGAPDVGRAQFAALQQALDNQASDLRTLTQPSDEERLARQQARQAEAARLEEERKVAREFREGSAKQYADVERQVNRPFLENNAAIALLGAGITGRRGETASGILKGIGAIEADKQARLSAARKEVREDSRVAMQMDSVNRQLAVAQQEKAYADMRGDREASLAAAQKIAELQQSKLKLGYDYEIKKEELKNQGIQAAASMMSARKPPAELALMEWLRDPKNKQLYEDIQSSKRAEDRNLKLYEIYMKNKLLLGNMSFEEFAAGLKEGAGASGAGAGEFKILSSRPK